MCGKNVGGGFWEAGKVLFFFLICFWLHRVTCEILAPCPRIERVPLQWKCRPLFLKSYLFIFDCARSLLLCRLFSCCHEWGLLSSCGVWASHTVASPAGAQALWCMGYTRCGVWARELCLEGSRAQASWLRCTGLVTPRHVGFSWIRDRTLVSCPGRQIPYS